MTKILDLIMKLLVWLTIWLTVLAIFYPEMIKDFIEWMRQIINSIWNWNYLIVFSSSLIEWFPVLWVVVPWQNILLIVWWFFWAENYTNLLYVTLIASIWAVISNYIWYYLWVYYWEIFFKKYWLWFGIWETEVKYLKKWIKKWWPWWIIVWKFHNLARAFVPFIAWTMGMHKKEFFIYNVVWSILRATAIVILWTFFAGNYEVIIDYFGYIMLWIMILTWIYIYKYKRAEFITYWKEKESEIEKKI